MRIIVSILFLLLPVIQGVCQTADLTLRVKNIEEIKGNILLGIYTNEADYKASKIKSGKEVFR